MLIKSPKLTDVISQDKKHQPSIIEESIFSNSALESFEQCERRFLLRYGIGAISREDQPTPAMDFGTLTHTCLQRMYEGESMIEILTDVQQTNSDLVTSGSKHSLETLTRLLVQYQTGIMPFERGTLQNVEVEFAAVIDSVSPNFVIIGRIDRVWNIDGEIYLRDWKTTSVFGADYWTQYILSDQITAYLVAYEALTNNQPIGFYIDVIRVTQNELKPAKGETQVPTPFPSRCFQRSRHQKDAWIQHTSHKIGRIKEKYADSLSLSFCNNDPASLYNHHHWYPCYSSCINRYGRTCEYHDLCRNWNPEILGNYLRQGYNINPDNKLVFIEND